MPEQVCTRNTEAGPSVYSQGVRQGGDAASCILTPVLKCAHHPSSPLTHLQVPGCRTLPRQRQLGIWEKPADLPVLGGLLALGKYLFNEPVQEYTDISVCNVPQLCTGTCTSQKKRKKKPWNEQSEHVSTYLHFNSLLAETRARCTQGSPPLLHLSPS